MAWLAEKLLTAIRDDKICDCISEERLVMLTDLTPKQVADACCTLIRNQLLSRTKTGCHQLTGAGKQALISGANLRPGVKVPGTTTGRRVIKGTLRTRVWSAIRIRRKFSVAEIVPLVVSGTERGDCTSNVEKYIRALRKAGYLTVMVRKEPGSVPKSHGHQRYWLQDEKDTGPQAPVWRADFGTVYDPNTEAEVAI
jgi:hypothetical protein